MRDFIKQTGQDRDYFREQNYPKENYRNSLTFSASSGNIEESTTEQDYMKKFPCEKACANNGVFKIYKLHGYENVWSQTYSKNARKTAEYVTSELSSGVYGTLDRIIIAKNVTLGGIAAYAPEENALYISEELIDSEKFSKIVSLDYFPAKSINEVLIHELGGHKKHWDIVKKFYSEHNNEYKDLLRAKMALETNLYDYVSRQRSFEPNYILKIISKNAHKSFLKQANVGLKLNELIADATVLYNQNEIRDKYLFDIIKELMNL